MYYSLSETVPEKFGINYMSKVSEISISVFWYKFLAPNTANLCDGHKATVRNVTSLASVPGLVESEDACRHFIAVISGQLYFIYTVSNDNALTTYIIAIPFDT